MAVVAMSPNDTPIICNGFKDAEYVELAMMAQKIGRHIIPVVEKYTELELILKFAEKLGVRPQIGIRVKLAARGSGRWQSSGGYREQRGVVVSMGRPVQHTQHADEARRDQETEREAVLCARVDRYRNDGSDQ